MLTQKYEQFRKVIDNHCPLQDNQPINTDDFDAFIQTIVSDESLLLPDTIYGRDGFCFVKKLDTETYQMAAFQINSFGPGIFSKDAVKYTTPLLLTVSAQRTNPYVQFSLDETPLSITDVYLGKSYCGSKGKLCDREKFIGQLKPMLLDTPRHDPFNHHIVYQLMNANFICHHIAETLAYAFAGLDLFWRIKQSKHFLCSASRFNEKEDALEIEMADDFAMHQMHSHFNIPTYTKLLKDIETFKEKYESLLWEVTYQDVIETFRLPLGFQKEREILNGKSVNFMTTALILQHLLKDYYKRKNAFIVAGTFQVLEYLSRAFLAKMDGLDKECANFMNTTTFCMGYYPDRDFESHWKKKKSHYSDFDTEFAYMTYFKPPVLD